MNPLLIGSALAVLGLLYVLVPLIWGADAAGERAELESSPEQPVEDAAERLIAQLKSGPTSCPSCGPRPEAVANFCSDCGRYLAGVCRRCGATAESPRARFCAECGASFAG